MFTGLFKHEILWIEFVYYLMYLVCMCFPWIRFNILEIVKEVMLLEQELVMKWYGSFYNNNNNNIYYYYHYNYYYYYYYYYYNKNNNNNKIILILFIRIIVTI